MTIDRRARVLSIEKWDDYVLLRLACPSVGRTARPGQFVMVKVSAEPFPLLRRPLSLHAADASGISLFFKVCGLGTEILSRKRDGDVLDVLGPLGKGFSVSEALRGKRVVLVGGGRGAAPLFFLGGELKALGARVEMLYGGRCLSDIPLRHEFEAAGLTLACSTDDGAFGYRGLVTDLLRETASRGPADFVFACGPEAMMKAVAGWARKEGVPAEFSLESVMGCGIGACWGCVRRVKGPDGAGWTKICEDGPVFSGDRIVWED